VTIDVTAERRIPLPTDRVADYAMDWRNDAVWTQGIRAAELTREAGGVGGGFGVGAELTRTAYFLGRRIDYVLRVAEYRPGRLLVLEPVVGPMPMHITYAFDPRPNGTTLARIRVRGDIAGYYPLALRMAAPLVARRLLVSIRKDLRDLERALTRRP